MSYETPAYKENYQRPASAAGYINYSALKVDTSLEPRGVTFFVPASNKIGPAAFAHFAETDTSIGPKPLVICSGYPFMFGSSTGGDKLGILTKDAVPGERVSLDTAGTYWLELDYLGDAGATPARVAASVGADLSGRPAYWMPTIGLITDQKPASGGQVYLEVGYFIDSPEKKPKGIDSGIYWAKVKLTNAIDQDAVAWPSVTPSAASNLIEAFASVNYEIGDTLTVDILTDAYFNNPAYHVADAEISWAIDTGGTTVTLTGRRINYTGTAGTKACTLDITSNGVSMTQKTFNLVLHATNAPTLTET